jgi:hypothetical protein
MSNQSYDEPGGRSEKRPPQQAGRAPAGKMLDGLNAMLDPVPGWRGENASADGQPSSSISEDLAHGQIVIVTARWILVLAALVFIFWSPGSLNELRILTPIIMFVAVANFYLHAQLLKRRPAIDAVVYGASLADLVVVSLIIAVQGGFRSDIYLFYFPAFLGFSVAFPTRVTVLYAAGAMCAYGSIATGTMGLYNPDLQVVVARLVMLGAVAACGNLYWRIEAGRRRAAAEARDELMGHLRGTQTAS